MKIEDVKIGQQIQFRLAGSPVVHRATVERFSQDGDGQPDGGLRLGDEHGWKQCHQVELIRVLPAIVESAAATDETPAPATPRKRLFGRS